jgi:hypothetical protein
MLRGGPARTTIRRSLAGGAATRRCASRRWPVRSCDRLALLSEAAALLSEGLLSAGLASALARTAAAASLTGPQTVRPRQRIVLTAQFNPNIKIGFEGDHEHRPRAMERCLFGLLSLSEPNGGLLRLHRAHSASRFDSSSVPPTGPARCGRRGAAWRSAHEPRTADAARAVDADIRAGVRSSPHQAARRCANTPGPDQER